VTKDEAQHRRWTFYEAVKVDCYRLSITVGLTDRMGQSDSYCTKRNCGLPFSRCANLPANLRVTTRHHITVCVCTYKRPGLLGQLLAKLEGQAGKDLFDYSIVIIDNDQAASAKKTVESHRKQSDLSISYDVEPEQNISLARNKAVEKAEGDLIAFIDDDEFPVPEWLRNLHGGMIRYNADGILGPVLPRFEEDPPQWVSKGRFFDRPTHPTGHVLDWENTRTGNALLKRELFKKGHVWFDPAFGSGGEDRDFFKRKIEEGHTFVWCNEAPVFETVPRDRWKKSVLMKRALLRGKMALKAGGSIPASLCKSACAFVLYTVCLPVFFLLGEHVFMKYLIKICDHLGKILAFFGIELVKEKYVNA
jgi:succinoglycan biosynthesis protein ExoM